MAVFNPFQLVGDVVHFSGKILLLYKTLTSKECTGVLGVFDHLSRDTRCISGISLRTQLLYLCVFLTRYIDLLTVFVSWYAAETLGPSSGDTHGGAYAGTTR